MEQNKNKYLFLIDNHFVGKRVLLLFFFVVVSCQFVTAGDIGSDLKKMNQQYDAAKSFNMKIELQLYTFKNDNKPASIQKGEVKKKEAEYFSQMEGKIYIKNGKNILAIDNDSKTIIYGKDIKDENTSSILPYDSILNWQVKNMKYVINNPDIKKIQYTDEESEEYGFSG